MAFLLTMLFASHSAMANVVPKCFGTVGVGKIVNEASPASAPPAVAVPTRIQQLTASDIQLLFKQDGEPIQFAVLSEQEMKETRGCSQLRKNVTR